MARIPDGGIQDADHPDAKTDDGLGVERRMLDGVVRGRSGRGIGQSHPIGVAFFDRIVRHGRPSQVHRVQCDDRRLKQTRIRIGVLDLCFCVCVGKIDGEIDD